MLQQPTIVYIDLFQPPHLVNQRSRIAAQPKHYPVRPETPPPQAAAPTRARACSVLFTPKPISCLVHPLPP